jgi:lipoprotein-anchoring transpeptidase ErfK/SrfK
MNIRRPESRPRGFRGGAVAGLAALVIGGPGLASAAPAPAPRPWVPQPLVVLLAGHVARRAPDPHAGRIERVAARRPLTGVRTVLPVIGRGGRDGAWLRVRLPGRPNGHTGWIADARTRSSSSEWGIRVDLSARRVTVYRDDREVRRFAAVVGKPSTPTPRGRFFVEEALALAPSAAGAPYALATSARSNVLGEFDGGPGQIALHGRDHLAGALGSAASHGCIRLSAQAITWLARRIGAGTPLTVER